MRRMFFVLAGLGAVLSCGDPVHSDAVSALGPEDGKVRPGPDHRPGQPCLVCHGGSGPGSPELAIAGTIYAGANDPTPASGITVEITDANGAKFQATTRRSGNFQIDKKKSAPVPPLRVRLVRGSEQTVMLSDIGRAGSCAECHAGVKSRSTMPAVYWSPQ